MQYKPKLCLLEALGVMLLSIPHIASGQFTSTCDRALGEAFLDVNNVRARILNTGGLFWRGEPHVYEVPKGSGSNAIFATTIWIAGRVRGQLRASASLYGEWEMWAGPLDDHGNPPADCSRFDRVFKVSRKDILDYEKNGSPTPDLFDWPTGLGAPTYNTDGDLIELLDQPLLGRVDRVIDLEAGERPAILGDQSIWWVMNDRGNQHTSTDSPPIGLEVHVMAYAFDAGGDIGNTTFYKYNLFYKGKYPLLDTYFGIFSDPDLGNFDDDYVGSDSLLGLAYVYNSDNVDEGREGYGTPAPAAGYDFVQGPIVPSPGSSAVVSGRAVPGYVNLQMTTFAFWNSGGGVQGGPGTGEEYYSYMRGLWLDGKPFTVGGSGRGFSEIPTHYMFSGDPVVQGFWTEVNSDGLGTSISPGDRRFTVSTGPFTIEPGAQQEIVFSVVWAIGNDNWDSVRALRDADRVVQAAFDADFVKPEPPHPPAVTATPFESGVILAWTNPIESNNYLESYVERNLFATMTDQDYVFEGYKVLKFDGPDDEVGEVIATYDVVNGITRVIDLVSPGADAPLNELNYLSAGGTDSGIQHTHSIGGLTNQMSYFFGVQAYAYNAGSTPKTFIGEVSHIEVIPHKAEDLISAQAIDAALDNAAPDFIAEGFVIGSGTVSANVVIPGAVLENATYVTRFYEMESNGTAITYDIERNYLGETETMFDGSITGTPAPQRDNVMLIDGLQFSVTGPAPGMMGFKMIANGGGFLEPPDMAAFAFNSWGFPLVEGRDRPESGRNQSTNPSTWGIHVGGGSGPYGDEAGPFNRGSTWVGRSIREGSEENPWPNVGSDDFEWRFPESCFATLDGAVTQDDCVAWRGFEDNALVEVPFQLWNTGPVGDPFKSYRMLPLICERGCGHEGVDGVFDIAGDHPVSGGRNDPFSDWIYWYKPEDNGAASGQDGYESWFWRDGSLGERVFSRQVLVNWNGGHERPYDADMVEPGTIIQYNTNKLFQPGDALSFNTTGFGVVAASDSLKKTRLADISIVPNPYLLASAYERTAGVDEVRITNLPVSDRATIRVYTLSGTLISTLEKPTGTNQLAWNLATDRGLPIGSGIYLIHVEVDGVGSHVIKFAAIKKAAHGGKD